MLVRYYQKTAKVQNDSGEFKKLTIVKIFGLVSRGCQLCNYSLFCVHRHGIIGIRDNEKGCP